MECTFPQATAWTPRRCLLGLEPKIAGSGARENKAEGFTQEVHRRHPPLGRRGQERRVDRQRPGDEPFVGAIVPLAQRYLPPRRRLDAARPAGLLLLRGRARAGGSRHLVRSRDRQRPALAETLEKYREGRAAPHTDQDRLPEARGRQGPGGDSLASISARSCLKASASWYGIWRLVSICSRKVPRSCGTRSLSPESLLQKSPQCVRGYYQHRTGALRTSENAVMAKF